MKENKTKAAKSKGALLLMRAKQAKQKRIRILINWSVSAETMRSSIKSISMVKKTRLDQKGDCLVFHCDLNKFGISAFFTVNRPIGLWITFNQ